MQSLAAALLIVLCSCAPSSQTPKSKTPFVLQAERAHLTLPPSANTASSLVRFTEPIEQQDLAATWVYVHYMIDLFDWSRFHQDEAARTVLLESLHVPLGQGVQTTNEALEKLIVVVDRISAVDRLHVEANAARVLLQFDRQGPQTRGELFRRIAELKGIARGHGPLEANAYLRLANFCDHALRDAANAPTPKRPRLINYCLYPLFDSDPEPYFASDPSERPPYPAWRDLIAEVDKLFAQLGKSGSRIAALGGEQQQSLTKFMNEKKSAMPTPRAPKDFAAPMVERADPYEWTPLLFLGDGSKVIAADVLQERLRPVLAQDDRKRVALALAAHAPAATLLRGAHIAGEAGAHTVDLVVGYEQLFTIPPGDYWHTRTRDGRLSRLGTLSVVLPERAKAQPSDRDRPRSLAWNPDRARLGLHLLIGAKRWQIVAPEGTFPPVSSSGVSATSDGARVLRKQLGDIRRAYPDEDGLRIVVQGNATYAAVAQAIVVARYNEDGSPLFSSIGLTSQPPTSNRRGNLSQRVADLARAQVSVKPDVLTDKRLALRRCYLAALHKSPRLTATFALELQQGKVLVAKGPQDATMRGCVVDRLRAAMIKQEISTVSVRFSHARK